MQEIKNTRAAPERMRLRELAIAHEQRGRGGLFKEKEGLLYAAAAASCCCLRTSRRRWNAKQGGEDLHHNRKTVLYCAVLYWKGAVEGHSMTATQLCHTRCTRCSFSTHYRFTRLPNLAPPLVGFLNSRQGIRRRRRRRRRRVPKQKAVTPHILSFPRSRLPG